MYIFESFWFYWNVLGEIEIFEEYLVSDFNFKNVLIVLFVCNNVCVFVMFFWYDNVVIIFFN